MLFTPHFTSAISAFGIVFSTYAMIVLSEIWFVYRVYFVDQVQVLARKTDLGSRLKRLVYQVRGQGLNVDVFRVLDKRHRIEMGCRQVE